jgi:hypothetical protein
MRATMLSTSFDRGGAEGDLMELNGWTSPQMLNRYGRSARGARGDPPGDPHRLVRAP